MYKGYHIFRVREVLHNMRKVILLGEIKDVGRYLQVQPRVTTKYKVKENFQNRSTYVYSLETCAVFPF